MSNPARSRTNLISVDVPRSVWSSSRRPLQGRLTRALFGFTLVLLGLSLPWPAAIGYSVAGLGVVGALLLPSITDRILERRESAIIAADRGQAPQLLAELERSVLVSAFAPDAWVTLQRGRLLLAQDDGRAAAQAFADTARILQSPAMPVLRSAQARALLVADDRSGAREHLLALADADELAVRDRLDLGMILLDEANGTQRAYDHLQAAYEQLQGHPQAGAALAIATVRIGQNDRAMELFGEAEADAPHDDVLAQILLKRARKALRPAREAAKKKRKKQR